MNTSNSPQKASQTGRSSRQREKKINWLTNDERAKRLLAHFNISLAEPRTKPLFGPVPLQLHIYDDNHELTPVVAAPTLDYMSQDLGLVDQGAYESIKTLKIADHFQRHLFETYLQAGKKELNRYLRHLRPLLTEQEIYLNCITPVSFYSTDWGTSHVIVKKGRQPLSALPMSVSTAQLHGYTDEQITNELAPSVAWLIPRLVFYRQIKEEPEVIARLDGWLARFTQQQREQIYVAFLKYNPRIVTKEVARLLLPR